MRMDGISQEIKKYTEERFGPEAAQFSHITEKLLETVGAIIYSNQYGFTSMSEQGDAVIVYDLYTKPEYRGTKKAWTLFEKILEFAQSRQKRCVIGFSQKDSKNQHLGIAAMTAAGFIPLGETETERIYIRGV